MLHRFFFTYRVPASKIYFHKNLTNKFYKFFPRKLSTVKEYGYSESVGVASINK